MTCYSGLAHKIRRAVRNGSRLHLDAQQARALMSPPIYPLIALLESDELNSLCEQDNQPARVAAEIPQTVTRLGRSGSGIAPIGTIGPSAGIPMGAVAPDVGLAASRLASEAVKMVSRQRQRRMH